MQGDENSVLNLHIRKEALRNEVRQKAEKVLEQLQYQVMNEVCMEENIYVVDSESSHRADRKFAQQ